MSPKLHHTLKNLFRIFLILFGNACIPLQSSPFILPSGIITGGTTGLALASAHWFHTPITAVRTVLQYPDLFTRIFCARLEVCRDYAFVHILLPDLARILAAVPGAVLPDGGRNALHDPRRNDDRAGIGIVIRAGASTGRYGHPALILKKLFHLPVSATLYVFDFSILVLQMFFSDIEESLYGILLVMIYTFVLDKVLVIGTHQARADIVSSHYEEIRQAIFYPS